MLRRIAVMNSKGGCGKTTVATNLASFYASQNVETALFDYDSQYSSTHWLELRSDRRPAIHAVGACATWRPGVTRSWQLRVPPETQRAIIDTPGGLDRSELAERLRMVDVVLIPVLPSPIDIRAAADFIREVLLASRSRSNRPRLGIIPNRVRANTRSLRALRRFLDSLEIPIVGQLRDTQAYVHATNHGLGIHELRDNRIRRDARTWNEVVAWVERRRQPDPSLDDPSPANQTRDLEPDLTRSQRRVGEFGS